MSIVKSLFGAAVTFAIAGVALSTSGAIAAPSLLSAEASIAANDLENVRQVQQVSLAVDGLYAPSLEWLMSGDFGIAVEPRENSQIAYVVNADRTHYVIATQLPSGQVIANSDETAGSIACKELNADCIGRLSADTTLLSVVPVWVAY